MNTTSRSRRRGMARWLMLALLVVPVVEVFIIIKVGQTIGGWQTFALLVLWSGLGALIVKRESSRAFGALRQAFGSGRMPARELTDAALVLIGGTLLLAPGFLTDFVGLFFLLPITRPLVRRLLEGAVAAKLFGTGGVTMFSTHSPFGARTRVSSQGVGASHEHGTSSGPYPTRDSFGAPGASQAHSRSRGDVIEGEIID